MCRGLNSTQLILLIIVIIIINVTVTFIICGVKYADNNCKAFQSGSSQLLHALFSGAVTENFTCVSKIHQAQ